MTVREVTVNEWTCSGCGTVVYLPQGQRPDGIHSETEIVENGKDVLGDRVWGCRETCYRKAIKALISGVPTGEDGETNDGTEPEGRDARELERESTNA